MRFLIFLFIFLQTAQSTPLTLEAFLQDLRSHPKFISLSLTPHIQRMQSEQLKASQDISFEASPNLYYEEPVGPSNFLPNDSFQVGGIGSLQKSFWKSGARAKASYQYGFSQQDFPNFGPGFDIGNDRFHQHRLLLEISQPLLKNFGGTLDRIGYDVSQFNVSRLHYESLEKQEEFLLTWATRYLNWAYATEETKLVQARVELAERQLRTIQKRLKSGISERVDVLQSQASLNLSQQLLLQSQNRLKTAFDTIAMIRPADQKTNVSTNFKLDKQQNLPDLNLLLNKAQSTLRIKKQLLEIQNSLAAQKAGVNSDALPELNLNIQGGLQSGNPNYGSSADFNNGIFGLGLTFSVAIGNRLGKSKQKEIALRLTQSEKDLQHISIEIKRSIVSVWNELEQVNKLLALNQDNINTNTSKIEAEQRLFQNGRRELSFVIAAQDAQLESKLQLISNLMQHHLLHTQLDALSDELLISNNG